MTSVRQRQKQRRRWGERWGKEGGGGGGRGGGGRVRAQMSSPTHGDRRVIVVFRCVRPHPYPHPPSPSVVSTDSCHSYKHPPTFDSLCAFGRIFFLSVRKSLMINKYKELIAPC